MKEYRDKKHYRPKRTALERGMAQFRGYWEPQDLSKYERDTEDIVKAAIKDLGLEDRFDEQQVFDAWNDLVDNFISQNARPTAVNKKVLYIQVLHSTVHYELERMKGQILKKMQDEFGKENIREVRFRLG